MTIFSSTPYHYLSRPILLALALSVFAQFTQINTAHAEAALPSYNNQNAWKKIQKFLPAEMQFDEKFHPAESWWEWKGNNIHLDQFDNAASPYRVILLHGVGTNGRQMSMIVGGPLAKSGIETIALDLPGYGLSQVNPKMVITYADWVDVVDDFIEAEHKKDKRPIVLYGLSAGGMLTYHVAAKNRHVAGIIGMTFLDQRDQKVRDETAHDWFASHIGGPAAHLVGNTVLGRITMPMKWVSKMSALVNNEEALAIFLNDKSSAGNWVSTRFLDSYLNYAPALEPEDFSVCPILLTQPGQDRWTPLALSKPFLSRILHVPVKIVMLDNAGHYPLEQPGLQQLKNAIMTFLSSLPART